MNCISSSSTVCRACLGREKLRLLSVSEKDLFFTCTNLQVSHGTRSWMRKGSRVAFQFLYKLEPSSTLFQSDPDGQGEQEHLCAKCMERLLDWKTFKDMCQDSSTKWMNLSFKQPEIIAFVEESDAVVFIEQDAEEQIERVAENGESIETVVEEKEDDRPLTCDICQKPFKTPWRLKTHKLSHADTKSFTCEICGKDFKFRENYKMHIWRHSAEKSHECQVCNKKFYLASELRNHAKRHDPGKKSFACPHCDETFYNSSNLKDHLPKHTRESPFVCEVCGRRFQRMGQLKSHGRIHTGEKPFACDLCKRAFRKMDTLKQHMKTHR